MVDELLCCDDTTAQTKFVIDADNVLVVDGFFTEAGLMENIAQTAAAHAGFTAQGRNEKVTPGYIAALKNFEVFKLPKVNDEIATEIKIETQVFDITQISGMVTCNGETMAKCEMNIFTGK